MYRVRDAAALSGLTVRALHHYDAIGLLRPSGRSAAGYRLYDGEDVRTLRCVRRYRGFGFSLDQIGELLAATEADRVRVLRNQRDAIRRRALETAGILRAINKEITLEDAEVPADRSERAQALVSEYLERSKSAPVPQLSMLLVEAFDLLRPLTVGKSMQPAAVRLAACIHQLRCDWANLADLCQRFLGQELEWEDRAFATLERVGALTLLERHEEAVAAHRAHIKHVMAHRPATEWADAMWNSMHTGSWVVTARRDEWMHWFRAIDAGVVATVENRADRYELLHTAVMVMGGDETDAGDIDALAQRMADIIAEDPDWSERLWAEQRLRQQEVNHAVRRGDPESVIEAVNAYRSFLENCDWPDERIGVAYSNLGAIMHWQQQDAVAVEYFGRAQQRRELDGYGYAWFASASLGAGAPRERVAELLAEAGRRLETADAMRIFNADALLSSDVNKDDLLDALLQPA